MSVENNYVTTAPTIKDLIDRISEVIDESGEDRHWFIDWGGDICIYSRDAKTIYQIEADIDQNCPTELIVEKPE